MEKTSHRDQVFRAMIVEAESDDRAGEEHNKYLERRYPCDLGGRFVAELVGFIVVLEDADAVEPT